MIKKEKRRLPQALTNLTIKLKSYAFMKIFMTEIKSQKHIQKLRHYDLQLQGATAITSCLKNKVQQIYLRCLYQLKNTHASFKSSKVREDTTNIQLQSLKSQKHLRKPIERFRAQTDREAYKNQKNSSYQNQKIELSTKKRKGYQSQYDGRLSQQSQKSKKSNLQALLNKVREVNSQSKLNKQNQSKNQNYAVPISKYHSGSIENSRANCVSQYYGKYSSKKLGTPYMNSKHQSYQQSPASNYKIGGSNAISFCRYASNNNDEFKGKNIKTPSSCKNDDYNYNSNYNFPQTHQQPSDHKYQNQEIISKESLMNSKKWKKNQKRNIIMNKIMELESSLFNQGQGQKFDEFYVHAEENTGLIYDYGQGSNYVLPSNYSQGLLNYRARQPPRSAVDVKVRHNNDPSTRKIENNY